LKEMDNLEVLDNLNELTLKNNPPNLSEECIRSLLQQSLILAKSDSQVFLNLPLISKAFLSTTHRYSVYTLIVEPGIDSFDVSFGKGIDLPGFKGVWFFDESAKLSPLSYGHTLKLVKMLSPTNFYIKLENAEMSDDLLDQCEALFKLIPNGNTGLSSFSRGHATALNRLAPYLNVLDCDFDVLELADVASSLNLVCYNTFSMFTKEKLMALLCHNIQSVFVNRFRIGLILNLN